MRVNKYYVLLASFIFFAISGYYLFIEYVNAIKFAIKDGGIQAGYDSTNLEIILTVLPPIILVIHIIIFILFKMKENRKSQQSPLMYIFLLISFLILTPFLLVKMLVI